MIVLHTSDWHIGRSLYGRKRYEEFEAFLDWMHQTVTREKVDVLLIAGDVFDTSTPGNRAQELYYRFLSAVSHSCCRHVVVIAGNHDSPSFLNAPRELLRVLNVHVIGSASEDPEDEIIVLRSSGGVPELIICAVPYLRDRDIRVVEEGESTDEKGDKLIEGIRKHYSDVYTLAEKKRRETGKDIPIIAAGHLFTAGGETTSGDGGRELYVGSLARVGSEIFPQGIDYVALGHLHLPQLVNNSEFIRYSGSPLPMGFGEARQKKSLYKVEFAGRKAVVSSIQVPLFQQLEQIRGTLQEIRNRIVELAALQSRAWLEVVYQGEEVIGNLREQLEEAVAGTGMEILLIKNNRVIDRVLNRVSVDETLDDLTVIDVFKRCLKAHEIPEEQQSELHGIYREILSLLYDEDVRAE